MVFTVIGGGPHVAKTNGPIDIFSYHLGKGDATFYSTFPELDHTISKSFGAYCHRVFREHPYYSLRAEQTLTRAYSGG